MDSSVAGIIFANDSLGKARAIADPDARGGETVSTD